MTRSMTTRRALLAAVPALLASLTGSLLLKPAAARPKIAGPAAAPTPEAALRRYVAAVNSGDFHAQYGLFAPVEHEGWKPAPIPLLPEPSLRRLLSRLQPSYPDGLKLGSRPVETLISFAGSQPAQLSGFLVPIIDPGRPASATGRYRDTYLVAVEPSPHGWKIRAWATYWMYFDRAQGTAAGQRFRQAYRDEAERLGLLPRSAGRMVALRSE